VGGSAELSILVAFRAEPDSPRSRLWDFVRARLEADLPQAEIVVGTDDGIDPFHKALALNRAAAMATSDVLGIFDADCYIPPEQVASGLALIARKPMSWCKPWTKKYKLDEPTTAAVLAQGTRWDGAADPTWRVRRGLEAVANHYWSAPPVLMSRAAFETVGGMDERFRGWGGDDDQLAFALRGLFGPAKVLGGYAIHLWHPRVGQSGRDQWLGQDRFQPNAHLTQQYRRASRSAQSMRELLAAREA